MTPWTRKKKKANLYSTSVQRQKICTVYQKKSPKFL